jgi:hypothetical protein
MDLYVNSMEDFCGTYFKCKTEDLKNQIKGGNTGTNFTSFLNENVSQSRFCKNLNKITTYTCQLGRTTAKTGNYNRFCYDLILESSCVYKLRVFDRDMILSKISVSATLRNGILKFNLNYDFALQNKNVTFQFGDGSSAEYSILSMSVNYHVHENPREPGAYFNLIENECWEGFGNTFFEQIQLFQNICPLSMSF